MNTKFKRTAAMCAAVVMAGSVLTACGGSNSGSTATTTAAAGETTTAAEGGDTAAADTEAAPAGDSSSEISGSIKVLHHRTDRDQDGTMAKLTEGFNALYPNVTVEYQSFTNYADDIATMMQSDNYGDVVMTPQALKQADLPNFFASFGSYSDLSQKYYWLENYTVDGQVYALPTGGTASGVLYNKKVWADAGITSLPTTTDEFLACLKQIAENTDAIPYYTNYNASWCITQWQSLVVGASGDPDYNTKLLTEKTDLFSKGSPYDAVYGTLFDIYADPTLHEEDPMTTDWEGCKPAFAQGKIATMVLGSWAISQFQEAAVQVGSDPADVGYMPFPNSIDGKIYSVSSNDYMMSVNKNTANMDAAMAYATWFCTDSGFAQNEGEISGLKGAAMPETLSSFDELGVQLFVENAFPEELIGKWDEIAKASEVDPWGDASTNYKFRMAEAAFDGKGRDEYDKIAADVNAAWAASRDEILG
ncbi:ABC transporter substrate-binding protein [Huintestinicola sp.]|uniref:ABC transporter substrate-binding protein n=1 Tax=Huintestinicola sp. TaxID=2981661 RepID=UPI003D7CCB3F